jgi:hypothetical protein
VPDRNERFSAPISTGSVSDLVGFALQLLLMERAACCWDRGHPVRNERFSAKRSSSNSTQGEAINSTRSLTKGLFAPKGAHCGREAPQRRCSAGDPATPALPGSASRYNPQGAPRSPTDRHAHFASLTTFRFGHQLHKVPLPD